MIKACIFDLDGTLANTLDSMAYVANEILRDMGLKEQPTENFKYYSGEGADMLVRRVSETAETLGLLVLKNAENFTERSLMKIPYIKWFRMKELWNFCMH